MKVLAEWAIQYTEQTGKNAREENNKHWTTEFVSWLTEQLHGKQKEA